MVSVNRSTCGRHDLSFDVVRKELMHFAHKVMSDASSSAQTGDTKMEVDSTASTPFGS